MNFLASFMNLAGPDLIVILLIILVLFGAKKLPELARGMGQAGKSETETAKSDVKPAQSTVPRSENQPSNSAVRSDPNQTVTPGDKADQV
jgi:sec-independent protein translocase protein TatA